MTEFTDLQRKIMDFLPEIRCCFNELLSKHTSFRIGGPAEVMLFPNSEEQLADILKVSALLDVKPTILGAGTNVLAPDAGVRGIVVCLKDGLDSMEQLDFTSIRIGSGVTMSRAAMFAGNLGLTGLEFAHGIPGTVGGGVYMNAGAYGGEIGTVCRKVRAMTMDGQIHSYDANQMDFSYRHSVLQGREEIVLSAEFSLQPSDKETVLETMRQLQRKRSNSQPLDLPSAGSAFKRPVGGYAAALIDQAGLRGFRIGDAAVSEKHAGFAVNLGAATAENVKSLLQSVSDQVFAASGIHLEPEIRIW